MFENSDDSRQEFQAILNALERLAQEGSAQITQIRPLFEAELIALIRTHPPKDNFKEISLLLQYFQTKRPLLEISDTRINNHEWIKSFIKSLNTQTFENFLACSGKIQLLKDFLESREQLLDDPFNQQIFELNLNQFGILSLYFDIRISYASFLQYSKQFIETMLVIPLISTFYAEKDSFVFQFTDALEVIKNSFKQTTRFFSKKTPADSTLVEQASIWEILITTLKSNDSENYKVHFKRLQSLRPDIHIPSLLTYEAMKMYSSHQRVEDALRDITCVMLPFHVHEKKSSEFLNDDADSFVLIDDTPQTADLSDKEEGADSFVLLTEADAPPPTATAYLVVTQFRQVTEPPRAAARSGSHLADIEMAGFDKKLQPQS